MKYRLEGMAITDVEWEMFQPLIQTDVNEPFIALKVAQNPDALWPRRRVVG